LATFTDFFRERAYYSPQKIEKSDSKLLSLATTTMDGGSAGFAGAINLSVSILGQPPRSILHILGVQINGRFVG
jgi:hypothetical protein